MMYFFHIEILFPLFDFKTVANGPAHCLVGEAVKVTGLVGEAVKVTGLVGEAVKVTGRASLNVI